MIIIIDGYNVLFHDCWPYHDGALEDRRHKLISLVAAFKKKMRLRRIIIVFDGCAGIGPYKKQTLNDGVEIIYAICQGKADEKIISLSGELNNVVVVTADRRVVKYSKRNRSDIISPQHFTQKILRARKREEQPRMTMPSNDIDQWLKEFGMDDEIEIPTDINDELPQIPDFQEEDYEEEYDEENSVLGSESVEDWLSWFRLKEDNYE